MQPVANVEAKTTCYHCGQACDEELLFDEKKFCCYGCKTVYEILASNDLCEYYDLQQNPGVTLRTISDETYAYLDEPDIRKKILEFDSASFARVSFFTPAMHCVSCIWLLENLQRLNPGILKSQVNFARKSVTIDFNPEQVAVSQVARVLASLGYAPKISLDKADQTSATPTDKGLVLKLAIAAFCFGNIMLFSFPEYLGLDHSDAYLMRIFSWLNVALSVPVLVYSASDYMRSAWLSFQQRRINIDLPIAIGLIALFGRSVYDVMTHTGPGYLDSFTGLVFFLLTGRWFQSKTYESLAFDRDFKSYFPLAVHKLVRDTWQPVIIYDLVPGDVIRVRNMEIVPGDSILLDREAYVDYSFVTGESRPVKVLEKELVYAGGRLIGKPVMLRVEKKTSQSHLTSLWNHEAFSKPTESRYKKLIDRAAQRFTWIVLALAVATAAYWYVADASRMWLVLTSVLMVACPCALALAAPFTYGNMLRVFGRNGLYLKNADIIERMAAVNAVVFDKTGTVTHDREPKIDFSGHLSDEEFSWVKLLTGFSTHPLSALVHRQIGKSATLDVTDFKELPGKGIEGWVHGKRIRIGSAHFTGSVEEKDNHSSRVYVAIQDEPRGFFRIQISLRNHIQGMLSRLGDKCVALLSGDNEKDSATLSTYFHYKTQLLFNQNPHDKLAYIRNLQQNGRVVMMVGDGLNDSGALKQSDVGLAVTDDTGVFTPACDGILQGDQLPHLDTFMKLSKRAIRILKIAFVISFFYNIIALSIAVAGYLTPLVAAILMPISSISVVGFATLAVNWVAKRTFKTI
jgi:Cu+-exporting ATPase